MLCFFLFWKAKQINMRVFFGVGRTIERMMALPKLFPFFLQISDPIFNHQIMGLFKQLINISLIDSYKFIIITQSQLMQPNLKWSQQEDELLMASVAKHGTQWGLVVKQMNNIRSQNAVIKRWHGYIRKNLNGEIPQTKPKTIQQEKVEGTPSKNEKKRKVSQSSDSQQMKDQNQQRAKTEKENTEQIKKIQEEVYQYKLNWSEEDDIKLKNFIINDGKLSWNELAGLFNTTQLEVMARWIKFICPKLKHNVKIGGAVKWSVNEDYILYAADRNKVSHLALMYFLPYRTVYSIEARWRRICKNSDIMNHLTVVNNRNNLRRDTLKKIAIKRCLQKRDSMSKIYEKQREIMEKQRQEQQKYDMMRRQDKMRKIQRM